MINEHQDLVSHFPSPQWTTELSVHSYRYLHCYVPHNNSRILLGMMRWSRLPFRPNPKPTETHETHWNSRNLTKDYLQTCRAGWLRNRPSLSIATEKLACHMVLLTLTSHAVGPGFELRARALAPAGTLPVHFFLHPLPSSFFTPSPSPPAWG